jgi:hypothetical protein
MNRSEKAYHKKKDDEKIKHYSDILNEKQNRR